MMRTIAFGLVAMLLTTTAFAQDDTSDNTPQENVRGAQVSQRAPGVTVRGAIQRHQQLQNERLKGAGDDEEENNSTTTSTGTTGSSLSDLLNLAGGLTGGSLSSLTNLLGTAAGSTSTTTGTSGTGLSSAEILQMIQESLARQGGTTSKPTTVESALTTKTSAETAADKTETRAQTTSGELKFRQRWVNTMLSTVFTSLAFGMQSGDFVDLLADGIRNLITPIDSDGDNNGNGSASGEGVEDVNGDGNTDGAGDSVVRSFPDVRLCC